MADEANDRSEKADRTTWGGFFPCLYKRSKKASTSNGDSRDLVKGDDTMNQALLKLTLIRQSLLNGEEGQDLVEYALLLSLIALGCITAIGSVTTAITGIFSRISTSLT